MKGGRRKVSDEPGAYQRQTAKRDQCLIPPCSPRQEADLAQETEIEELQQRVKSVRVRFSGTAGEDRKRNRRLASLVGTVEEGLARSQRQVWELSHELARANEKNHHLEAMLQDLLRVAENAGAPSDGAAMRDLEGRINRLAEEASAIDERLQMSAPEATGQSPVPRNSNRVEELKADPEPGAHQTGKAARRTAGKSSRNKASARGKRARDPASESPGLSAVEPGNSNRPNDAVASPRNAEGKMSEPLELTEMAADFECRADAEDEQGHSTSPDLNMVQDIFKRVSMMTGKVRDGRG